MMSHERTITVSDKGQRISTLTKVSVIVFENGLIRLSMTEHLEDAWAKRPKRTAIDIMLMPDEAEALGLGLDIPQQAAQIEMTDWPKYESHKIVQAMPITGITPDGIVLVGARHEPFHPSEPAMAARAEVGGYAVLYADGFKSVSPKKAFEEGYTRV